MKSSLVIGTRSSALARAQTDWVVEALARTHSGLRIDIRVISTVGDERMDIDLAAPGALEKGLFTKRLEDALFNGEIDVAVHSLKDLPVALPEGLVIAAIPERADPRDVLVSHHPGGLKGLPHAAHIATSSARRQKILELLRPDLKIVPVRGNVPTRLRKLAEGGLADALVLAKAGLDRLGNPVPEGLLTSIEEELLPAPGQGALGIECRADDLPVHELLAPLNHPPTARCVNAERGLLQALGGGCEIPLAAHATLHNDEIVLRSIYFGMPQM
jgi:hydroxymethylbilane synthase